MFLTFPQKTNRQLRYRCCRGNTSECLEVTRTTGANLSVSSSFSGSNGVPSSLARHNVTNLFLPEKNHEEGSLRRRKEETPLLINFNSRNRPLSPPDPRSIGLIQWLLINWPVFAKFARPPTPSNS